MSADFENMYGKIPIHLNMEGIRKFCQENNVFESDEKLYRQKRGHAIGQKQAPPVACDGAGIAKEQWLSNPQKCLVIMADTSMTS